MKLEEVVELCSNLIPDLWKYDDGNECVYDNGKLKVVGTVGGYMGGKRIRGFYEGKQFLSHREFYADDAYRADPKFESYLESKEFAPVYAKMLLMGDLD